MMQCFETAMVCNRRGCIKRIPRSRLQTVDGQMIAPDWPFLFRSSGLTVRMENKRHQNGQAINRGALPPERPVLASLIPPCLGGFPTPPRPLFASHLRFLPLFINNLQIPCLPMLNKIWSNEPIFFPCFSRIKGFPPLFINNLQITSPLFQNIYLVKRTHFAPPKKK